ncbi:MAG TPA: hypothetical protein VIG69_13885 [Candidatus Methylomirabilis sp.]|jgi:hypothetical protein
MAGKKAAKGTARKKQAGKRALKDLAVRGRRAKGVKGGLLPAVNVRHNYEGVSTVLQRVVNPSFKQ